MLERNEIERLLKGNGQSKTTLHAALGRLKMGVVKERSNRREVKDWL